MMRRIACLVLFGASVVFGWVYYAGYVARRECFNELGRCFDGETGVVYLEQSGVVWLMATVAAFGAGLLLAWRLGKRGR